MTQDVVRQVGSLYFLRSVLTGQIRERAERGFLSIPMFNTDDPSSPATDPNSVETARLCLTIIEDLSSTIPDVGAQSITPVLVEKMDLLLRKIVTMQNNPKHATGDQPSRSHVEFEKTLGFWFPALLKLVAIYRPTSAQPPTPKPSNLQEQSRLLISILCISLSRSDATPSDTGISMQTHALDVAASLVDTLPDEARRQCARFLKDRCPPFTRFQNDPRYTYLLGSITDLPSSTSTSTSTPIPPAALPSPAAAPTGSTPAPTPSAPQQPTPTPASTADGPNSIIPSRFRLQCRGRTGGPYPLRPWELLEDAAPIAGVNDTAISLSLFDARRVRT